MAKHTPRGIISRTALYLVKGVSGTHLLLLLLLELGGCHRSYPCKGFGLAAPQS